MKKILVTILILIILISCEKRETQIIPVPEPVGKEQVVDKKADSELIDVMCQKKIAKINELNEKTLPEIFAELTGRLIVIMRKKTWLHSNLLLFTRGRGYT